MQGVRLPCRDEDGLHGRPGGQRRHLRDHVEDLPVVPACGHALGRCRHRCGVTGVPVGLERWLAQPAPAPVPAVWARGEALADDFTGPVVERSDEAPGRNVGQSDFWLVPQWAARRLAIGARMPSIVNPLGSILPGSHSRWPIMLPSCQPFARQIAAAAFSIASRCAGGLPQHVIRHARSPRPGRHDFQARGSIAHRGRFTPHAAHSKSWQPGGR